MDQQQLMEKLMAQYEAVARENEQRMKAAVDRYEQMIYSAQSSIDGLLNSQAAQSPSRPVAPPPPPPAPAPPPQEPVPAAVWIKAPDGENFLLVNQAGAVMFLAIFERLGVVFKELEKLAPKRPGR
jgi:hypothetical protein